MSAALVLVLSLVVGQESPSAAPLRPAELVAQQVRSVLYSEDERLALQALAGALPELALNGGADLQATFAAARLAENLSSGSAASGEYVAESSSFLLTLLRGINAELLGTLLAMIAVSLAFWLASGRARPGLSGLSSVADDVKAFLIPHINALLRRPNRERRIRRALMLASSGIPLGEVARQTRISRDALSVLLSMSR